ncbi:unnamed protein product [Ambrosiozyma monospora]|uniref:Unnamed protein product n=1 Tax=Ambrosiozyma monospora TaxID=43982 RepID=A0A9W6Z2U3_AMBMO|nr:unnamed protein product [Ambrosiozyma monospora]
MLVTSELSETEESDDSDGLEIYGDSPFKKIPNFADWKKLYKKSKLYQDHIKKFNGSVPSTHANRLIMIGDIHGSFKQLKALLRKVRYNSKVDHVLMLGDFTNKGLDTFGVLEYAMENQFHCILGNHEIELLKRYAQFHGLPRLTFINRNDTTGKDQEEEYLQITENYDLDQLMKIAKRLTPEHIKYIGSCPLMQELGPVPHLVNKKQTKYFTRPANGVGVHAGLMWNVDNLEKQDPDTVTTVRNLLPPNWTTPTEDRTDKVGGVKGQFWGKFWAAEQKKIVDGLLRNGTSSLTLGTKVYYGHDAHRGLNLNEYSAGLDSSCVYGGQLTAEMVWSEVVTSKKGKEQIVYKRMLAQVNC